MLKRHPCFFFIALLFFGFAIATNQSTGAQDRAAIDEPLYWGADADGGIPYVIADPDLEKKRPGEPNGPVTGFEADLRDALEKELGRRILFKQLDFANIYTDLDQGNCDFAMNGLEIIPENVRRAAFTKPYYLYQQQLVIRANEKRFATLQECRDQKLIVGTLQNTAAGRILDKKLGFPESQIKEYKDQDAPYKDLRDRAIDAVLLDWPAAVYYATPYTQLQFAQNIKGLKFEGPPFGEGYYGIAVKKGNTKLLAQLDGALDRIRKSGELKRILVKWDLWNLDQYRLDEKIDTGSADPELWPFDRYFPLLLDGAQLTVIITLASFALAMAFGLPLALARLYGGWPMRALATLYVEFFRGIPVLLLLYFLYFGSGHFSSEWDLPWLKLNSLAAAILGFGLNYAAYEAEIYRAGIGSIAVGQWEAAASLGMSSSLTFRRIILPQAIRVILPPMTNDFVALFKDTSVVSIIAVVELSTRYQILTKSGGGYVEIGLCTAALYLVMSVPLGYLSRYLEKRWAVR
ncbi:MAG TPA: ABC transporter substrate-binding protein/permease [Gemmataceae bacterium]|nr:ABC transporter substrate-binding protein/permease [Gemmataceae bacterium]